MQCGQREAHGSQMKSSHFQHATMHGRCRHRPHNRDWSKRSWIVVLRVVCGVDHTDDNCIFAPSLFLKIGSRGLLVYACNCCS